MVQWLELHGFTAKGPGWRTKIPQATWLGIYIYIYIYVYIYTHTHIGGCINYEKRLFSSKSVHFLLLEIFSVFHYIFGPKLPSEYK